MDSLCETYISIKDPSNYSKKCIVCLIDNVVVGNIWSTVAASYGFAYSAILGLISMMLLLVRR